MNTPSPQEILDLVNRLDDYLSAMRDSRENAYALVEQLERYAKDYFRKEHDELALRKLAATAADGAYAQIDQFTGMDGHTNGYFAIVLNRLFWELSKKGALCFYVIDNEMTDAVFKATTMLFKVMGFSVVTPYCLDDLGYTDLRTTLLPREKLDVEKDIDEARTLNRHIFYAEKDASVNYLPAVLRIAEEAQTTYTCIFGNFPPRTKPEVTVLTGSFGDILR